MAGCQFLKEEKTNRQPAPRNSRFYIAGRKCQKEENTGDILEPVLPRALRPQPVQEILQFVDVRKRREIDR